MTRYLSIETYADTGFATKANLRPATEVDNIDDDGTNRWSWRGDGTGAGTLTMLGDEHYIAVIRSTFQNNEYLRRSTRIAVLDAGQLDIGVVHDPS